MNLDLGPAFDRARTVVNGLVAAIPSIVVALVLFDGFLVLAAVVKAVVARLMEARLRAHRNAGVAVGRLAQGLVNEGTVEDIQRRSFAPAMAGASSFQALTCSRIRWW